MFSSSRGRLHLDGVSRSNRRWILRCVARFENVDTLGSDTIGSRDATAFRICLVAQEIMGRRNGVPHVPRDFDHDLHSVSADRLAEAKYESNYLRHSLCRIEPGAEYVCVLVCE